MLPRGCVAAVQSTRELTDVLVSVCSYSNRYPTDARYGIGSNLCVSEPSFLRISLLLMPVLRMIFWRWRLMLSLKSALSSRAREPHPTLPPHTVPLQVHAAGRESASEERDFSESSNIQDEQLLQDPGVRSRCGKPEKRAGDQF